MLSTKGMRFPIDVILACIRWYAAYPLRYRHLEDGNCRGSDDGRSQGVQIGTRIRCVARGGAGPNAVVANFFYNDKRWHTAHAKAEFSERRACFREGQLPAFCLKSGLKWIWTV
jgi:hypothetical protein